ncbi:MAG: RNA polymerase sigma factor [Candidatus Cyclobacteriaceae bacterium M2_1C_046]
MKNARHMSEEEIRSEQIIVEQAKEDGQHFGKLYDKYFDDIFYFIYRRTDDEATTADLTSQTFYIALKKLSKYKNHGLPFSAWLFRIAANEINKYYRSQKKSKRVYSLEESRIIEIIEEAGEEGNEEKIGKVIAALNALPTEVIEIMELRFYEEKSFKEIAFILDISESSAKMRVYRTLEKLREQIENGNK